MDGRGGDRSIVPRIVDGVVVVGVMPIVVRLLRSPLDVVPIPSTSALLFISHCMMYDVLAVKYHSYRIRRWQRVIMFKFQLRVLNQFTNRSRARSID